jgi:hypothetical protein
MNPTSVLSRICCPVALCYVARDLQSNSRLKRVQGGPMKLCPNCGHRLGLLPRRWLKQLMCSHSCYLQVRARWWNGWKEELKQFFDPR